MEKKKSEPIETNLIGKYYLQHYNRNSFKDWYYALPTMNGMNSCITGLQPLIDIIEDKIDTKSSLDIDKSTYLVEYEVKIKIHKMTKKETEEWVNESEK